MHSPETAKLLFIIPQVVLTAAVAWFVLRMGKGEGSAFKTREADRLKGGKGGQAPRLLKPGEDPLANASMKKADPLRLSGIVLDGRPHEILGVAALASVEEIQKAYRERMKQYHPDRVGRPGTREWNDAQRIAEAINRAKDELMRAAQQRRGGAG